MRNFEDILNSETRESPITIEYLIKHTHEISNNTQFGNNGSSAFSVFLQQRAIDSEDILRYTLALMAIGLDPHYAKIHPQKKQLRTSAHAYCTQNLNQLQTKIATKANLDIKCHMTSALASMNSNFDAIEDSMLKKYPYDFLRTAIYAERSGNAKKIREAMSDIDQKYDPLKSQVENYIVLQSYLNNPCSNLSLALSRKTGLEAFSSSEASAKNHIDIFRAKIDLLVNKKACIERLAYWAYANSETIQTNEAVQGLMTQMQIPDGLAFLAQLVAYQEATIAIAINTRNFNEFSSPNLSRLVGTPQEIRVSIESFKQGKERAQAEQQIAYNDLFSQAYLFDFERKLNDSGLASTYPTAPAKNHLSTSAPKLYNPFHFLRETQHYPRARLKRSNLNERIYDTWNVIAGRVDPEWMAGYSNDTPFRMVYRTINYATIVGLSGSPVAQSLGIVDYLSIGLFPLLHVVLKAANSYVTKHQSITHGEQFNKEKSSLSFKALSWFLTILTGLINVIRLLIAAALTLLACPFVLMLHGGLSYFEPRPVRLRFYHENPLLSVFFDQ